MELARAHLLYGEWLRRERRRLDAREQLRHTHKLFTQFDMKAFAERARVELEATGEHPRKRTVETRDELTPQLGATPAQVALAWLLAQGDDIAPIPGTKRVSRVEENTAADAIELSAQQIQRLGDLTPASGERHDEANMAAIDR